MTVTSGEEKPAPDPAPAPAKNVSWKVKLLARGVVLFFTLLLLEVLSYVGGRVLRARGTFYDPGTAEGFARYLEARDPELGWPNPRGAPDMDASGARISPAFPDPSVPSCLSLYGDSFTYSDEVDHEHAWGNLLAKKMGCRVANRGVGGYGTDQALLRFRRHADDRSKVMLLGFATVNIQRNVNSFRALVVGKSPFSFKPRFTVGADGELSLVPMPLPKTEAEYMEIANHPERHLAGDPFLPGGPLGVSTLSFPYLASIAGLRDDYRIQAVRKGEPSHAAFFQPDHPARGLQVTAAIARAFVREVAARGSWGAVVVIPISADLEHRRKKGGIVYQPLVDELKRAGVPYLDTTEQFFAQLGDRDACAIYTRCQAGHFTEEGYAWLAEYVHAWLKAEDKL